MGMQYTRVYTRSRTDGIQNRHDAKHHHPRDGSGSQIVVKASTRTRIFKNVMGQVSKDNGSRDALLARAFVVVVAGTRSIRVQCKAKLC